MKSRMLVCAFMLPVLVRLADAGSAQSNADATLAGVSTDALVARAGDYARRFERSMATVVLEERYVQVIKNWTGPPKAPDEAHLVWADDLATIQPDVIVKQRRHLKSDVLLVQLPDQSWTAFRDTFEVNGRLQPNREDRLRRLFVQQTEDGRRQLRRINEASADWNLGGFYREVNLPTVGLFLILPRNQRRFAFRAGAIRETSAAACRVVTFNESSKPTVVRSLRGRDVPLTGEMCIDAGGVVSSTRINLDPRYATRGAIDVTYRRHERVDVRVPDRMWEWYLLEEINTTGTPTYVEAMATYSNLRQFAVTTSEQVK
jgi:hypothetical protein